MNEPRFLDFIYITRGRARALGFTHEGKLFGAPAWMTTEGPEVFLACPKFVPLQLWAMLADAVFEFASHFVPSDRVLVSPIYATAPIGELV